MDFSKAVEMMEQGKKVKRPLWKGYLFLDIDDNVKHAGKQPQIEEFWIMDTHYNDWEECMNKNDNQKDEITTARIEALMDQSSSHIKRLGYLEDIIEINHKAATKLVDSVVEQMDETRRSLSSMSKFISTIKEKMVDLSSNFNNMKEMEYNNKQFMVKVLSSIEKLTNSHATLIKKAIEDKKSLKKIKKPTNC